MKVLLLGGSGLLGHNVLLQLLNEGHEVCVLTRKPLHIPENEHWHSITGSILDLNSLSAAASGCDAIINCAGTTNMSLLSLKDYLPVNRDLCGMLVQVMEQQSISRLVHVSTANTIGYGTPDSLTTEQAPMRDPFTHSFYAQSKLQGEAILRQAAQSHPAWHVVIVNPGFMIGAYDTKPSSGALLLAGWRKPIMTAPKGGKSFIAAAEAASAAVHALTMGQSGQRYLLTGENMGLKEFYALQARVMGYKQHFFYLPHPITRLAGWGGDLLRFLGIRTQVCTRNVRQLMVMEYYDNTKTLAQLRPQRTSVEEAIKQFFDWHANAR